MAKPAARLSDPTDCPVPGHGTNPIVAGSPNVLFDGLPAARQTDASECGSQLVSSLSSTVIINGLPAATVGSGGSHGNVVIGGSGTVLIGDSHSAAPFQPPAPLRFARTYAQDFVVTDSETGKPLAYREFIATVDGKDIHGVTAANGIAHVEAPSASSTISIHVLFKSPARTLDEFKKDSQ